LAQKVTVALIDDLDGDVGSETVSFGLDGKRYDIDLSQKNADELRELLSDFVTAARVVTNGSPSVKRQARSSNAEELQAIRDWAAENGLEVAKRGRIARAVVDAYHAAH
jgi:hypothetical protein